MEPNILDKAFCLSISYKAWGIRRKIDAGEVLNAPNTDKEYFHATKDLLKCKSYENIISHFRGLTGTLRKKSIPFPLQHGVFLIPITNLEYVDSLVAEAQEALPSLVNDFVENEYDTAKTEAHTKLGETHFKEDQYPSKEELRKSFGIKKKYLSFSLPEKLKEISEEVWKGQVAEHQKDVESATVAIRDGLRTAMNQLVSHLIDKLKPGEDGRPKRFKAASIDNVKEFLEDFKHTNITNDVELEKLADKCRMMLEGVSPEFLRADEDQKVHLLEAMENVKLDLDKMIEFKDDLRVIN